MRDLDKIREKTAIHLDTSHVFGLFLGGAVAAALLFGAGVKVGQRMAAPAAADFDEDPLRSIDLLTPPERLTFEAGLTRDAPPPMPAARRTAAVAAAAGEDEGDSERAAGPRGRGPASARAGAAGEGAAGAANDEAAAAAGGAPAAGPPAEDSAPAAGAPAGDAPAEDGRFTLQLSSFPLREKAEEFAAVIAEMGYSAYVINAEVPGKGVFYRVRFGDFLRRADALEAKTEFEREHHIIAYVARR